MRTYTKALWISWFHNFLEVSLTSIRMHHQSDLQCCNIYLGFGYMLRIFGCIFQTGHSLGLHPGWILVLFVRIYPPLFRSRWHLLYMWCGLHLNLLEANPRPQFIVGSEIGYREQIWVQIQLLHDRPRVKGKEKKNPTVHTWKEKQLLLIFFFRQLENRSHLQLMMRFNC